MPGVIDSQRKTKLKQEKLNRKKEKEELLRMLKENRLHEADERQLETIQLALELSNIFQERSKPENPTIDNKLLAEAIKEALVDVVSKLPSSPRTETFDGANSTSSPNTRPTMRHVDLSSIKHEDSGLNISHDDTLTQEKESTEDTSDKLKRLRELKRQKS